MRYNNIPEFEKILGIYPGEIFVDITEQYIPGIYPYYMLNNYGRVYHKALGKLISLGISTSGYFCYPFSTINGPITTQIHRLEMIIFKPIDGYEELDVNHEDGNKLNNFIGNLEWASRSDNISHSFNTGLHPVGEDLSFTKISNAQAKEICDLLQSGLQPLEISRLLNINSNIIQSIKNKDTWKHVSEGYEFVQKPRRLFTMEEASRICEYFANNNIDNKTVNDHSRDALLSIGINPTENLVDTVRKIYNRKYYTNISQNYIF